MLTSSNCAWIPAPDSGRGGVLRITGRVTCDERIALPAGAVLHMTLQGLGRADTVVARYVIRPEKGKVPIRFALEVDSSVIDRSRRYGISARITDARNRVVWATENAVPVSMSNPGDVEITVRRADRIPPSGTTTAKTLALECGGVNITVRIEGDKARVLLPDRALVLDRDREAAGTKYEHGGSTLVVEGDAVFLDVDGRVYRDCEARARAPGRE